MWVASNDVEKVIDWFYRRSSARFLGVFVAGDRNFDSLLRSVVASRQTFDVILGPCIDLVLFSNAEFESEQNIPVRHISNLSKWTPQRTRGISNATFMSTNDIASSLKLGIDDLPGLVLLRKRDGRRDDGSERLVLSLRGATDVDFLVDFFRAFRKSLERVETARSTKFRLNDLGLAEIERNVTSRAAEAAVIEKCDKRISRYLGEAQLTAASSDDELEQARIAEQRLNKAKVAKYNARHRIAKLDAQVPIETVVKFMMLADEEIKELQAVLDRFERRLSYALARDRVFRFLGLSEITMSQVKRIIQLAAAIKAGSGALL